MLVFGITLSRRPQIAKYVVALGEKVAATDIEEGMRVGVDRVKYSIELPLPPKIDPTVTMMTVEEKVRRCRCICGLGGRREGGGSLASWVLHRSSPVCCVLPAVVTA